MQKRERLKKTLAGEAVDRPPVALWRHWPGDDQNPADLAAATLHFQEQWDWDFIKASPASSYSVRGYGVEDIWVGDIEGTRDYVRYVIHEPADWHHLAQLDPTTGALGHYRDALRLIRQGAGEDVPILATIFSPLAQAKNIIGRDELVRHVHQYPQAVHAGLKIITDNTRAYLAALQDVALDGIFYAVQHATYTLFSETTYREFGLAYDLQLLEALPESWWFNMLHLHGQAPMFKLAAEYPVQAINWHDRETSPDLRTAADQFTGALCGGLGHFEAVHNGTPDEVTHQAQDAIRQMDGRRFILSTGCVMMTTTPQANIRAVRQAVEP